MDTEKKLKLVQFTYAAVLADATAQFAREGILERVVARKRAEQMAGGQARAAQFGVNAPDQVFTRLSEAFNCAAWSVAPEEGGFVAETPTCTLCAIAKKMNAPAPCALYCLDSMEGMVKGLHPQASFTVEETLWSGEKCRVRVTG